jgi:hypothetical protein
MIKRPVPLTLTARRTPSKLTYWRTLLGDTNYTSSTASVVTQRVVSASVVGLAFANVQVDGAASTPTCAGSVGTTYTCTVTGPNWNSIVTANVTFANASQSAIAYGVDNQSPAWSSTGRVTASGTVTILANQSTSSTTASAQKSGSSTHGILTVTFNNGSTTWTAVLQIN